MPRNVQFSKTEILQIYLLKAHGMGVVDIARLIEHSKAGIYRILSKGDNFETIVFFKGRQCSEDY